jgi:hypothetical protein
MQSLWPQFYLREWIKIHENPGGENEAMKPHRDGKQAQHMPTSVLICLSDGDASDGGKTLFPNAGDDGTSVLPRKGTALTWLNMHADGQMKEKCILHGVEAATSTSTARLVATLKFHLSPKKIEMFAGEEAIVA